MARIKINLFKPLTTNETEDAIYERTYR
jgi:hypothetical protein